MTFDTITPKTREILLTIAEKPTQLAYICKTTDTTYSHTFKICKFLHAYKLIKMSKEHQKQKWNISITKKGEKFVHLYSQVKQKEEQLLEKC